MKTIRELQTEIHAWSGGIITTEETMPTKEEISFILDLLAEETVIESTKAFSYKITEYVGGYSKDPKISALQAKLSIMLEVAT